VDKKGGYDYILSSLDSSDFKDSIGKVLTAAKKAAKKSNLKGKEEKNFHNEIRKFLARALFLSRWKGCPWDAPCQAAITDPFATFVEENKVAFNEWVNQINQASKDPKATTEPTATEASKNMDINNLGSFGASLWDVTLVNNEWVGLATAATANPIPTGWWEKKKSSTNPPIYEAGVFIYDLAEAVMSNDEKLNKDDKAKEIKENLHDFIREVGFRRYKSVDFPLPAGVITPACPIGPFSHEAANSDEIKKKIDGKQIRAPENFDQYIGPALETLLTTTYAFLKKPPPPYVDDLKTLGESLMPMP